MKLQRVLIGTFYHWTRDGKQTLCGKLTATSKESGWISQECATCENRAKVKVAR